MSTSANDTNLFYKAVKLSFENWTAFQLALAHNFGGSTTKEKAEWFLDATYQWITENGDLEDYEIEEFFEDTMNAEFNTMLEDNSAIVMARLLINYYQMYKSGRLNELQHDLTQKFPQNKASKISSSIKFKDQTQPDNESSSDECSDEEDEANNNDPNCEDMNTDESDNNLNKNKLNEQESQDFEMVEEGWTFVAKSGKHLTK